MPFTLKDDHEFEWPATIKIPADGRYESHVVHCRFRVLDADEEAEILRGATRVDTEILRRVWVGWREGDVLDEAGEALPFSDAVRDRLLGKPYVRAGLVVAYYEAVGGRLRKN